MATPLAQPTKFVFDGDLTPDELDQYMQRAFGVYIPKRAICPGHCAPWEAFKFGYYAHGPIGVIKGSRGLAGKSFLLAALSIAESSKLGASSSVLGGSGEQSNRVLEIQDELWRYESAPRHLLSSEPAKHIVKYLNGAKTRALKASQTSARGGHPQRMRLDEIDEMDLKILDAALGQPMAAYGIKANTLLSSTHQYMDGTMTEVLSRAIDKHWPIFEWSMGQGTRIRTPRGDVPIEKLRPEDLVLTRSGWRRTQHVTRMGERKTLVLRLSSGRTIRATADHRFATPNGWVRADALRPGASLVVPSLGAHFSAGAAVSSLPGSVGVDGVVRVPVGAFGPCELCADMGGSAHVLPMRDRFHVLGVVDLATRWYRTLYQLISEAMSPPAFHQPVPVGVEGSGPDPAVSFDLGPSSEVGCVNRYGARCSIEAIRAGFTALRRGGLDRVSAGASVHVASIADGVSLPVWDIGVEGDHEFVAEGVIVHNCYRECLEENGGWLSQATVEDTRATVTILMWNVEYELQEPSAEDRAFDMDCVKRMFDDDLGFYDAPIAKELVFEQPLDLESEDEEEKEAARHQWYASGADWARKQDETVMATLRTDVKPWRLVAFQRVNRIPWPEIVRRFDERLAKYEGVSAHDATGLGDVVDSYLEGDAEPVILVGRSRKDLFSEYIRAVENDEIRSPMIKQAYKDHLYCTYDDLFGAGHPPDSVVAMALAYFAGKDGGVGLS